MQKMAFSPTRFCGLTWMGFCDSKEDVTEAAKHFWKRNFFVAKVTLTDRPEIVIPSEVEKIRYRRP